MILIGLLESYLSSELFGCKFKENQISIQIHWLEQIFIANETRFSLLKECQQHVHIICYKHTCAKLWFIQAYIIHSRDVCKLTEKDKKLSYTRTREIVLAKLKLVAPCINLEAHSLKFCWCKCTIKWKISKTQGRWKADLRKDKYIPNSIQKSLKMTEVLHL